MKSSFVALTVSIAAAVEGLSLVIGSLKQQTYQKSQLHDRMMKHPNTHTHTLENPLYCKFLPLTGLCY